MVRCRNLCIYVELNYCFDVLFRKNKLLSALFHEDLCSFMIVALLHERLCG